MKLWSGQVVFLLAQPGGGMVVKGLMRRGCVWSRLLQIC